MPEAKRCIVFDLDGTLAHTVKDIANSVNLTRKDYGLEELDLDVIIGYTGDGALKLLQRSFSDHEIDWEEGLQKMIRHYAENPVIHTTLYPGVKEGLAKLKEHGFFLATVTNKPGIVAREILQVLAIDIFMDDVIGGGDGFALKPDPEVMFHLLKKYDCAAEDSWVLGDNHTDMYSASNAAMKGAYATWGFGFQGESPCDVKVDTFEQFTDLMVKGTF